MAKCQFCGTDVPEGQKCNCPESIAAVSSSSQPPVLEKKIVTDQNSEIVADVPKNDSTKSEVKPAGTVSKNQLTFIATAAAVLVVFILIVSSAGSYKTPVKNFFNGLNRSDPKLLVGSVYGRQMVREIYSDTDIKDQYDRAEENIVNIKHMLEYRYGTNVKFKYTIKNKEKISSKDIKEYEDYYEVFHGYDADIKKAYVLELDVLVKGMSSEDHDTAKFVVAKIKKNGWKLYEGSMIEYSSGLQGIGSGLDMGMLEYLPE